MGGCISVVDGKAAPCCKICGTQSSTPWGKMDATQRAAWVWEGEEAKCRKCVLTARLEQIQYERERKAYKRAKEEMYPKPSEGVKPHLKRLNSNEEWKDTGSFYQGWRPPSALKRLLSAIRLAQAEDPSQYVGMQRKPTGFVPATAPGAAPADPAAPPPGLGARHADACEVEDLTAAAVERLREEERFASSHRELAALEEEHGVEEVEEESLGEDASAPPSVLGTVHEGEEGEAAPAAAAAQRKLTSSSSSTRRRISLP